MKEKSPKNNKKIPKKEKNSQKMKKKIPKKMNKKKFPKNAPGVTLPWETPGMFWMLHRDKGSLLAGLVFPGIWEFCLEKSGSKQPLPNPSIPNPSHPTKPHLLHNQTSLKIPFFPTFPSANNVVFSPKMGEKSRECCPK